MQLISPAVINLTQSYYVILDFITENSFLDITLGGNQEENIACALNLVI